MLLVWLSRYPTTAGSNKINLVIFFPHLQAFSFILLRVLLQSVF